MAKRFQTIEEVIGELQKIANEHPNIEVLHHDDISGECGIYHIEYKSEDELYSERVVIG
ncbi:hypothetical protein D3C71_964160 [compost metagenome]